LPIPLIENARTKIGDENLMALQKAQKVFPLTSSLGRLFDAVAALIFFGTRQQFEGQAAMMLEGMMSEHNEKPYPCDIELIHEEWELSPLAMLRELVSDLKQGIAPPIISRRFHESIAESFIEVCHRVREQTDLNRVALSGGCMQNSFLLTAFEERLQKDNFVVFSHEQVPCGDGGVALGQAVIANAQGD
jgi:hydrogenase maturation protein HypF